MKFFLHQKRLSYLLVQRNILVGFCTTLLIILLLQSALLFFKHEKIIIHPPEIKQSYWVEGNRFSQSYIEEMALFFAHLLLDVSEENILLQGEVLLRYVPSELYGNFKNKLLSDEKRLKKQQLSLHFTPKTVEFPKPMTADVMGILTSYVAKEKVSEVQESYRFIFSNNKGRLFLNSVEVLKSEREIVNDSSL